MDPDKKDLEVGAGAENAVVYAEAVPVQAQGFYSAAAAPAYNNYAYNPAVVPQQQQQQQGPIMMVIQQPTVVQPTAAGFVAPPAVAPGQQLLSLPQGGHVQPQYVQAPVQQYNQPTDQHHQAQGLRRKQGVWSSGICDCLSQVVPSCFLAWFCSCFLLSRTTHQAGTHSYWCTMSGFLCSVVCQIIFGIFNLPIPIVWAFSVLFSAKARGRIRARFQIPGSCCEDFILSALCYPCTLSQMVRQINDYNGSCDCDSCDVGVPYGQGI